MKNCIQIRQKDTIRRALPDEFKDNQKRETAQMGNEAKYELAQTTEFDTDENRGRVRVSNLA